MTWHDDISLEVAATFRSLSGRPYEALCEAMWLAHIESLEAKRESFRDAYSRLPERQTMRRRYAASKARARTRVVAVRVCSVCRKPYTMTAWDHANGRKCRRTTCSRQCGLLASGRHQLHKLNGRRDTLHGWCVAYGLAENTVRHRMRKLGMTLKQALLVPKMRGGRKAAAK
jgi:hypothetical protein